MFDRILVAFDGSPTATAILPYVSWLARSLDAKVELLTVTPTRAELLRELTADLDADDIGGSSFPYLDAARLAEAEEGLRFRAAKVVEQTAEVLLQQGISVTTRLREGDAADQVIAASNELPASMIAIATHGRSGIQRWFIGSVTTKVIRESRCPVLAVRPHEGTAPSSSSGIVVPLDGSSRAEAALPYARELAVKLALPVDLVRSVSLSGLGYGFVEDGPTQYADLAGSVEHTARDYLASVAKGLRFPGDLKVTESLVDKAPDEAIVDAAGAGGGKLVVMTTYGRSGLNRMVLGSVADRVIRNNVGPVLIVPSTDDR